MQKAEQFILEKLRVRTENGSLRKLPYPAGLIDFCSNDYLGFARSAELQKSVSKMRSTIVGNQLGSTGSRLITGNHLFTEETEKFVAKFHRAESGLIFNSGYDANLGLLSSLGQKGDTIILDELIHASLIDGTRLTYSNRFSFKHNNILDLEVKLKAAGGNVYVVVESVYSMDGDIAPLTEISELCELYQANLIVDEAHALGVFGQHGSGLVQHFGLENKIFARIYTFGKALGCHGAIILGSNSLRTYLINFARSFIYTTAAPIDSIAAIRCGYQKLSRLDYTHLISEKIKLYRQQILQADIEESTSSSTIQTLLYKNNVDAKTAALKLQQKGFDVRAILSPTVPEGKERLRICIHLFNTNEEITNLVNELKTLKSNS